MEKCGSSGTGSPTATGQPATRAATQRAVSGKAANLDLNNPQFWAGVGPAVFHGLQAIAKLGQSATTPAVVAAMEWPLFSGNRADYPPSTPKMEEGEEVQSQTGAGLWWLGAGWYSYAGSHAISNHARPRG
jgi:hypothetical protein